MQPTSGGRTRQLVLLLACILGAAQPYGVVADSDSMQLLLREPRKTGQPQLDVLRARAGALSDSLGLILSEPEYAHVPFLETERLPLSEARQVEGPPASASDSLRLILDEPASQFKFIVKTSDHEHMTSPDRTRRTVDEVLIALGQMSFSRASTAPAAPSRGEAPSLVLPGVAVLLGTMSGAMVFAASTCNKRQQSRDSLRSSQPATSSAAATELFLCPISCEVMVDPVVTASGRWNSVACSPNYCCDSEPVRVWMLCCCVFVLAGNTYERVNITNWLRTNSTDPLTNEHMTSKKLVPNLTLRSAIAEWRITHALPADEQSESATSSGDEQAAMELGDGGTTCKPTANVKRRDAQGKTRRSKKG